MTTNGFWDIDDEGVKETLRDCITDLSAFAVHFAHKELVERLHQDVPPGDGVSLKESQEWTAAKQRQLSELRRQMMMDDAHDQPIFRVARQHIFDGLVPVLAEATANVKTQASVNSTADYLNSTEAMEGNK